MRREVVLSQVPDGFRHGGLGRSVLVDPGLAVEREGDCFVGEVLPFDAGDPAVRDHFHVGERLTRLRAGETVPLALASRRSMMEFASGTGECRLRAGDRAFVLGGDGYAGSFECAEPDYGVPVAVRVLGAIVGGRSERPLHVADFAPPEIPRIGRSDATASVVAVVGSRMDCGKSTTVRRAVEGLRERGAAVAAAKVTGFGCRHETAALGADLCLDFTDFGLPSTCGRDGERVLATARRLLSALEGSGAEILVLEFGEALIGPYRVAEVLADLRAGIDRVVFVAFDLCGVEGGILRLRELGLGVDLVSGPVANTAVGVRLVEDRHGIPAESNRGPMPRLLRLLEGAGRASPCP